MRCLETNWSRGKGSFCVANLEIAQLCLTLSFYMKWIIAWSNLELRMLIKSNFLIAAVVPFCVGLRRNITISSMEWKRRLILCNRREELAVVSEVIDRLSGKYNCCLILVGIIICRERTWLLGLGSEQREICNQICNLALLPKVLRKMRYVCVG